jgi:hypothetical protein
LGIDQLISPQTHAFVVRIWWEPGLTQPDGRPLWRGQVQHAASGRSRVFQSLDELLSFIQELTGDLGSNRDKSEQNQSNGFTSDDTIKEK